MQNAVSPQRARPAGAAADGTTDAERQGRKLLPRYAVPHNFRHAQRVHASLWRVALRFAQWGCREVAADTLELAAAFLTDEEAAVSKAQADLAARASKSGGSRSGSPSATDLTQAEDAMARSASDVVTPGSPTGPAPQLASPGGNGELFGSSTSSGLPPCRVPLRVTRIMLVQARGLVEMLKRAPQYFVTLTAPAPSPRSSSSPRRRTPWPPWPRSSRSCG